MQQQHTWNFSTIGGVKRVNIDTGADLLHLHELDQKLWTALSCPVNNLEIDTQTLQLIDTDNDNQIRVPEILAAVRWALSILRNPNDLLKQNEILPLASFDDNTPEGQQLLASARVILKSLGKENQDYLSVEETSNTALVFAQSKFNGDGVITEDTLGQNEALIQLLNDIITCVGSAPDRNGKEGISENELQQFTASCGAYIAWHDRANEKILPFGNQTEEAYLSYTTVKEKIDDFFIRCKLVAFDKQTTNALNLSVDHLLTISDKNLAQALHELAQYPIARIEQSGLLPLTAAINPAWESALHQFNTLVIQPIYPSKQAITETDWLALTQLFDGYIQWKSETQGASVEALGYERIQYVLQSNELDALARLIAEDKLVEAEANSVILVDKLTRYHRDLYTLLKNFVTFYDFYTPGNKAIFQAGTLYIDQRSCDLCIKVTDMAKHGVMASLSGMFLLYCECTSKVSDEKMTIVAALTNGDIDNMVVGRNAIFYDRKGQDWDATVVKIIDNPISIRQAFWSPYRKVSRFIETQINKFAAEQDTKVTEDTTKGIEETQGKILKADGSPKVPAPPFDIGKFVGIFAAISLALGAIGTAIASLITGFIQLAWWKMPLAVAGIMLLISGPAMIMAYLKLRKRNLAPLLDANGWAINARATVNIHFGNQLTRLATLPEGAKINLNDPLTKKKRPVWPFLLLLFLFIGIIYWILWRVGFLHF
jgi:hypothetical protein